MVMSLPPPKWIYTISEVPIKILTGVFAEIDKVNPKIYTEMHVTQNSQKKFEKDLNLK